MKNMMKDTGILFVITLIAGAILALVYGVTKDPIALQEQKAKMEACMEVFKTADSFSTLEEFDSALAAEYLGTQGYSDTVNEVMTALSADQTILGYVLTITTHDGYSGDITFSMGITTDGTLNGISLLTISETPGLGMQAEEVLVPQFADKKVKKFEVTKSGVLSDTQIDSISGATITSNAITTGVNAGLCYYQNLMKGGNNNE